MTVSDEDLKYLVENDYYDIPIHKDKDVEFIDVADIARELLERRERDRWIPVSERLPEVGQIVQWIHKHWNRVQEGYLTKQGHIQVWGRVYVSPNLNDSLVKWRPLPEPPEAD